MKTNDFSDSTILFVDDEHDILELMQSSPISQDVGKVLVSDHPLKALELIKKERMDLVILDIAMPQMDGITLLKEMRNIIPGLACIYLSGHADKKYVQQALRLGVHEFLDKPFGVEFLQEQIRKALEVVYYERLLKDIFELFICENTTLDFSRYQQLSHAEKDHVIRAALATTKLKIANRRERAR